MNKKLTAEQLNFLAASEEFQERIKNDPVLIQLDVASDDPETDEILQRNAFHLPDFIGVLPVRPVTPLVWMNLVQSKNPCVIGGNMKLRHREEVLSLLSNGVKNCCRKTGLKANDIAEAIQLRIRAALLPWNREPAIHVNAPDINDTLPWLTVICSYAAQMSATPLQQVMENMSLSQSISLYGLQWHILNTEKHDQSVPPPCGNAGKMLTRAYELGAAFLAERHFNA